MRGPEPPRARDATVTVPTHPVISPKPPTVEPMDPTLATLESLREQKRRELDATLERLLLAPPGIEHARGPFAAEYDALAARRRALADEVAAIERALNPSA